MLVVTNQGDDKLRVQVACNNTHALGGGVLPGVVLAPITCMWAVSQKRLVEKSKGSSSKCFLQVLATVKSILEGTVAGRQVR